MSFARIRPGTTLAGAALAGGTWRLTRRRDPGGGRCLGDQKAASAAGRPVYQAVLAADTPETTRPAETISTWGPEIEVFLRLHVTNARSQGENRVIKQLKRVGCGYRNQGNYRDSWP